VTAIPFEEYVSSLGQMNTHIDPRTESPESELIRDAARSLASMEHVDREALAQWIQVNPSWTPTLGLAVGLSQERLKNTLRHALGTSSWLVASRQFPADVIDLLDDEFAIIETVLQLRNSIFTFGDVLVARAGTRVTASRAGIAGRRLEDEIEAIAGELGLPCKTRTRFVGRSGRTAPCDLVIPDGTAAEIVVAAKGFDSTGSKLTDAVREIEEMADVRLPRQFVIAVIDGIGWKSRQADLRRIHTLWATNQIDGMYTRSNLPTFRRDLEDAARIRGLL
jgi:hypothetical protein